MHNPHGIKLLTKLRVGLSHLRERKLGHNSQDSLDPFCSSGRHIETTIQFFVHCSNYSNQRKKLNEKYLIIVETLLFGSNGLNDEENAWIMESTMEYILTTKTFITPLI